MSEVPLKSPLPLPPRETFAGEKREFFIDNLLVQIHVIIVMIRWTGLAPWEFEFPFDEKVVATRLAVAHATVPARAADTGHSN